MSNEQTELMAQEHDMTGVDAEFVAEATEAVAKETVSGYKKIENAVVSGYKKIEDGVVNGYKKIEEGVVEGFNKVTDKCVEVLFAKDGETVEEAKARLSGKDKE